MDVPKRIRLLGVLVLVTGLVAAAMIYLTANPRVPRGVLGIDVQTKRETLELEKMGGHAYVLTNDFTRWFGRLWHGRNLAYTIAVLAAGTYLGSRLLADMVACTIAFERANKTNTIKKE